MPHEVVDNVPESRFEVHVDGQMVGLLDYRLRSTKIVFTHTEVQPEHEGKGLAAAMVKRALQESRDAGLRVVPLCPYVKTYIDRHPEYADLLDDSAGG